jgi:hypothetical protein
MPTLQQLIPDIDVLLALPPEELASAVMQVARSQMQNGLVNLSISHSAPSPPGT